MITGSVSGDFAGVGANNGGLDFVAIKLTAAGVEEWTWQVRKRLIINFLLPQQQQRDNIIINRERAVQY